MQGNMQYLKRLVREEVQNFLRQRRIMEASAEDINKIVKMPIAQFVAKFKSMAADPKVNAIIGAGLTDGNEDDEKMNVTQKKLPASKLIPTQNVIEQGSSLNNLMSDRFNTLDSFLKGNPNIPPVITYNGKYIIDGHHRWSQIYAVNPNSSVNVLDINGSLKPLDALKAVHMAIAADTGGLPLSNASGINMLTATKSQIIDLVTSNIQQKSIDIFKKNGKGDTPESIADFIWNNVKMMQTKNAPVSGAPDRNVMPQTGDAPNFDSLLKKGIVNFINPKPEDVKESKKMRNGYLTKIVKAQIRKQLNENVEINLDKVIKKISTLTDRNLHSEAAVELAKLLKDPSQKTLQTITNRLNDNWSMNDKEREKLIKMRDGYVKMLLQTFKQQYPDHSNKMQAAF